MLGQFADPGPLQAWGNGRPTPMTKSRNWSGLREEVCLGHWGEYII